eukprot:g19888.t1
MEPDARASLHCLFKGVFEQRFFERLDLLDPGKEDELRVEYEAYKKLSGRHIRVTAAECKDLRAQFLRYRGRSSWGSAVALELLTACSRDLRQVKNCILGAESASTLVAGVQQCVLGDFFEAARKCHQLCVEEDAQAGAYCPEQVRTAIEERYAEDGKAQYNSFQAGLKAAGGFSSRGQSTSKAQLQEAAGPLWPAKWGTQTAASIERIVHKVAAALGRKKKDTAAMAAALATAQTRWNAITENQEEEQDHANTDGQHSSHEPDEAQKPAPSKHRQPQPRKRLCPLCGPVSASDVDIVEPAPDDLDPVTGLPPDPKYVCGECGAGLLTEEKSRSGLQKGGNTETEVERALNLLQNADPIPSLLLLDADGDATGTGAKDPLEIVGGEQALRILEIKRWCAQKSEDFPSVAEDGFARLLQEIEVYSHAAVQHNCYTSQRVRAEAGGDADAQSPRQPGSNAIGADTGPAEDEDEQPPQEPASNANAIDADALSAGDEDEPMPQARFDDDEAEDEDEPMPQAGSNDKDPGSCGSAGGNTGAAQKAASSSSSSHERDGDVAGVNEKAHDDANADSAPAPAPASPQKRKTMKKRGKKAFRDTYLPQISALEALFPSIPNEVSDGGDAAAVTDATTATTDVAVADATAEKTEARFNQELSRMAIAVHNIRDNTVSAMNYQKQLLRGTGKKGKKAAKKAKSKSARVEVFANPRLMKLPLEDVREFYATCEKQLAPYCDLDQYEKILSMLHEGFDPTVQRVYLWVCDMCPEKQARWKRGVRGDSDVLRFVQNFCNVFPVLCFYNHGTQDGVITSQESPLFYKVLLQEVYEVEDGAELDEDIEMEFEDEDEDDEGAIPAAYDDKPGRGRRRKLTWSTVEGAAVPVLTCIDEFLKNNGQDSIQDKKRLVGEATMAGVSLRRIQDHVVDKCKESLDLKTLRNDYRAGKKVVFLHEDAVAKCPIARPCRMGRIGGWEGNKKVADHNFVALESGNICGSGLDVKRAQTMA